MKTETGPSVKGQFYLDVGALAAERDKLKAEGNNLHAKYREVTAERDELLAACKQIINALDAPHKFHLGIALMGLRDAVANAEKNQ